MLWYLRRVSRGDATSTVHRTAERASRRDFRICDLVSGGWVKQVTCVGLNRRVDPSAHMNQIDRINRRTVSR